MAQFLTTPWINTPVPGAYVKPQVISGQSGLASSGVIVIMGEAAGGPDYTKVTLKNNFFGPTALNQVRSIYTSGPIVNAFAALSAPSNDPDISGTATSIFILKTNKGTQASAPVAGHSAQYGVLSAQNYGVGGNLYNFTITSLDAEVGPSVTGTTISSYTGLSGASFSVRMSGGAATLITPMGTITNVATLVTSLNAAFATASVDLSAQAGAAPNTIMISYSSTPGSVSPVADASAYSEGSGKSFELIDSTPGDLAALGLTPGLHSSSQQPAVEVQILRSDTGTNEVLDVSPAISMFVGYEGTTGSLTIAPVSGVLTLTTTVTGGSGSNLSINLSQYTTISQVAQYINSQPGYSASTAPSAIQLPPSALDQVTAIGIASTGSGDEPGQIKNSVFAFQQALNTSTVVSFTASAVAGLPDPSIQAYLSGGLLGATLASDILNAISQLAGIQCNIIVPLFSQDSSADIAAGNTDPGSTYTINAINELLKSHCIEFTTPQLKRNRQAILSFNGTYVNAKAQAQTLATYLCAITCQQIGGVDASSGANVTFLPWYGACIAAGMQAGGFYKSICNHLANVVSFIDPSGYDSGDPADVADAIIAGLLVLSLNNSGIVWVSDQTTYGLDSNFVYNSVQAVYLSNILELDLAQYFQSSIVGKSIADISAAAVLSSLQQRFDYYKKLKMTTTSNDAPLGYKNASVSIIAPSVYINVEAKLTTSIYFVAIDLALSAVQQSAG